MTDGETVGDRLMMVRERWGMSPAELGQASGIGAEVIEEADAGGIDPGADVVDRLAKTLSIRAEWLRSGEEPMLGPTDVSVGQQMADRPPPNPHHPDTVLLFGDGPWYRTSNGVWRVNRDGEDE